MLALLGGILGGVLKFLTVEGAKAILIRALLLTAMTLVLPVVLYNVFSLIVSETLEYASSYVGASGLTGVVIQLTGVAAWMGDHLKVVEAVSFLLSCSLCRFVISMVRGV